MPRKKPTPSPPEILSDSPSVQIEAAPTFRKRSAKPSGSELIPAAASSKGTASPRPRGRANRTRDEQPALIALESPEAAEGVTVAFRPRKPLSLRSPSRSNDEPGRRGTRRTGKGLEEPSVSAAPEGQKGQARGRRPRSDKPKSGAEVPHMPASSDIADEGFPVFQWRERPGAKSSARLDDADLGETVDGTAPRRSRRRRRREFQDVEITAASALEIQSEPEEREPRRRTRQARAQEPAAPIPAVPQKPFVPVPADAPRVVLRGGVPTLTRNGRVFPPVAFFGFAPDEKRAETVLDEARSAGEAGVHLHSHLIEFEVSSAGLEASIAFAAYMLSKTVEVDPEAQVLFRLAFLAPEGWERRYPDAQFSAASGRASDPSVSCEQFWGDAREALERFVERMRQLAFSGNILGVHLERGEWFYADGAGYDTSAAATAKFREWARTRYGNDIVALRATWFDGRAEFDSLQVPIYSHPKDEGEQFMRVKRKDRRWVDYHLFLSDAIYNRIADLAYAAKKASEGYFLVGVSYGYTFEWSHPASGHLSLGKLLRTPEIDMIAGPPSYRNREPGGTAPFPCPVDSFALNGKLYLSEEDYKTAIGVQGEPDDYNPVVKTPQALASVHWRGAGAALAHASGVVWMDSWGNGWLKTSTIWDRAKRVSECLVSRMAAPLSPPDVAVFIDERALAYLVDQTSFALLVQDVRESVLRSGLSAGFYLLSDLAHREQFPDSKLYIFLNAWDMRPEHRAAIKTQLQRDDKVLFWLYCAGHFDAGRESLERAREVTGIALKPQPFHSTTGTTILNRRHPLCEAFPDRGLIASAKKLDPSYFAIPEESTVLGEYSQTGLPSFVVRDFRHESDPKLNWRSVFLGEPVVTPALVRALGHMAGAHVWNYQDDVVHVRPPFLTVHCRGAGTRALTLPANWVAHDLLDGSWEGSDSANLKFNALDGSTHLYLVGLREELDAILSASPSELLELSEVPAQQENLRANPTDLDVPIVQLDQFIEGGVPDDISDDWFLRPRVFEQTESEEPDEREESEPSGRRRRRRGRRSDRPMAGPPTAGVEVDPELGMHVLFRKRE